MRRSSIPVKSIFRTCISAVLLSFTLFTSIAMAKPWKKQLDDYLDKVPDGEASVIVLIKDETDASKYLGQPRHEIINQVKEHARNTQSPIRKILENEKRTGSVKRFESYFVVNALAVKGKRGIIRQLAERDDVAMVIEDKTFQLSPDPVISITQVANDWNGTIINAPPVWTLGYDGSGYTVIVMDTGVDVSHPDLLASYSGLWKDCTDLNPTATPEDLSGHGTHVAGIIAGQNYGIAKGAQWAAVRIFDDNGNSKPSVTFCGFDQIAQWAANYPSKNIKVANHSWTLANKICTYIGHTPDYWNSINYLQIISGVLQITAAGNCGVSGAGTVSTPGDYPQSFTVGSTDHNDMISSFSSRGPVSWGPDPVNRVDFPVTTYVKPDISAPGEPIYSTWPGGGYAWLNGTSMATPHVSAAAAIVMQGNPGLTIDEVKGILEKTAIDYGPPGKDNSYGWGRLNLYGAAQAAFQTGGTFNCTVKDQDSLMPLYAQVYIIDSMQLVVAHTTTDPQTGQCLPVVVPQGNYHARVIALGYTSHEDAADTLAFPPDPQSRDFKLTKQTSVQLPCAWSTPYSPQATTDSDIFAYINNLGQMPFSSYDIYFRLWNPYGTLVVDQEFGPFSPPGNTGRLPILNYDFPDTGIYHAWLFADPTATYFFSPPLPGGGSIATPNRIPEDIEDVTNNIFETDICAHEPIADIVAESIDVQPVAPCSPTDGVDILDVYATIKNAGKFQAGPFDVTLYIDDTTTIVGNVSVNLLFPGQSVQVQFTWNAAIEPGPPERRNRRLIVVADPPAPGTVVETSESNNTVSKDVYVYPWDIDLYAEAIELIFNSSPACARKDEQISARVKVRNLNGANGQDASDTYVSFNHPDANISTQQSSHGPVGACQSSWFSTPTPFYYLNTGSFQVVGTAVADNPTEALALQNNNTISDFLCVSEPPVIPPEKQFNLYTYSPPDIYFLDHTTGLPIYPSWHIDNGQNIDIYGVINNAGPQAAPTNINLYLADRTLTGTNTLFDGQTPTGYQIPALGAIPAPWVQSGAVYTQAPALFGPMGPNGQPSLGEHVIILSAYHPDEININDNKTNRFLWVGPFNDELCLEFVAPPNNGEVIEGISGRVSIKVTDERDSITGACIGNTVFPDTLNTLHFMASNPSGYDMDLLSGFYIGEVVFDGTQGLYSFDWTPPCGSSGSQVNLDAVGEKKAFGLGSSANGSANIQIQVHGYSLACAANPASGLIANGQETSNITCTLTDDQTNPVSGQTVAFSQGGTADVSLYVQNPVSGYPRQTVTNSSGQAMATIQTTSDVGTAEVTAELLDQDAACRANDVLTFDIQSDTLCQPPQCPSLPANKPTMSSINCDLPISGFSGTWYVSQPDTICVVSTGHDLSKAIIIIQDGAGLTLVGADSTNLSDTVVGQIIANGDSANVFYDMTIGDLGRSLASTYMIRLLDSSRTVFDNVLLVDNIEVLNSAQVLVSNSEMTADESGIDGVFQTRNTSQACFNHIIQHGLNGNQWNAVGNNSIVHFKESTINPQNQNGILIYESGTLVFDGSVINDLGGIAVHTPSIAPKVCIHDSPHIWKATVYDTQTTNATVEIHDSYLDFLEDRLYGKTMTLDGFNHFWGDPFNYDLVSYSSGALSSTISLRNTAIGEGDEYTGLVLHLMNGSNVLDIPSQQGFGSHIADIYANDTSTFSSLDGTIVGHIETNGTSHVKFEGTNFNSRAPYAQEHWAFTQDSTSEFDRVTCSRIGNTSKSFFDNHHSDIKDSTFDTTISLGGLNLNTVSSLTQVDIAGSYVERLNYYRYLFNPPNDTRRVVRASNSQFGSSLSTDFGLWFYDPHAEFITQDYKTAPGEDFAYSGPVSTQYLHIEDGSNHATQPAPVIKGPLEIAADPCSSNYFKANAVLTRIFPAYVHDNALPPNPVPNETTCAANSRIPTFNCLASAVLDITSVDGEADPAFKYTKGICSQRFPICGINSQKCDEHNLASDVGISYSEPVDIDPEAAPLTGMPQIVTPANGDAVTEASPLIDGRAQNADSVKIYFVTDAPVITEPAQDTEEPPRVVSGYTEPQLGISRISREPGQRPYPVYTLSYSPMHFHGRDYRGIDGTHIVFLDEFRRGTRVANDAESASGLPEAAVGGPVNMALIWNEDKSAGETVFTTLSHWSVQSWVSENMPENTNIDFFQYDVLSNAPDMAVYEFHPVLADEMPFADSMGFLTTPASNGFRGFMSQALPKARDVVTNESPAIGSEDNPVTILVRDWNNSIAQTAKVIAIAESEQEPIAVCAADDNGAFACQSRDLGADGIKKIYALVTDPETGEQVKSPITSFTLARSEPGMAVYNYPEPFLSAQGTDIFVSVPQGATFRVEIIEPATRHVVKFFTEQNATAVERLQGAQLYTWWWDARTASGAPAAPGTYTVHLTQQGPDGAIREESASITLMY